METGIQYELAFVVVTYNSEAHIHKCITSIYQHMLTQRSFCVVVVDNKSADNTIKILSDLQKKYPSLITFHLERNLGFANANNHAFRSVKAKYYVLLNQDAWLIGDSLSAAVNSMTQNNNVAVCGIPLVFPDGSPQTYTYAFSTWRKWLLQLVGVRNIIRWLQKYAFVSNVMKRFDFGREYLLNQKRPQLDFTTVNLDDFDAAVRDVDWVCGAAMLLNGDFVTETKGFDPDFFMYGEDEDLCIAAHQKGERVIVVNTIPIVHVFGWGKNQFNLEVAENKYRSLQYFIQKNIDNSFEKLLMNLILPLHVFGFKRILSFSLREK